MTLTALGPLTPRRLVIEVHQLPPAECSPNARVHWSARYRAGRCYGLEVFYAAIDARNRAGLREPFERARLRLTFIFPVVRDRDFDNLTARFKPGLDALVRAGLLVDDSAEHLEQPVINPPVVDRQRAPLTRIEIEEIR